MSIATQANGLISVSSSYDIATTVERLLAVLEQKGMKVFAHIDHGAGAKSIDADLAPSELIIFGNPQTGTPLMQSQISFAIDLPQKFLVSSDKAGGVNISFNDPIYLAQRHGVNDCDELIAKVGAALNNMTQAAAV